VRHIRVRRGDEWYEATRPMMERTAPFAHRFAGSAHPAVFWIVIAVHSLSIQAWADSSAIGSGFSALGRAVVLANALLDFDELIFNRWSSRYGHVQESWASSVLRDGGLYILSGLKSGSVTVRNLLENSRFENGMAVQTMRSLTCVHPGEQLSCGGCHEDKWEVPRSPAAVPLVARRPPSALEPEAGGPAPVTFGLVRPIFQKSGIPGHQKQGEPPFSFEYNLPAPAFPDPQGKSQLSDYCYWFDASNNNDGLGPYGGYRSTPLEFGFAHSRLGQAPAGHPRRMGEAPGLASHHVVARPQCDAPGHAHPGLGRAAGSGDRRRHLPVAAGDGPGEPHRRRGGSARAGPGRSSEL
jgi:hypothetical protein